MAYPTHGPEYHERLGWAAPCRAATTANVAIATALNAGDTIDGVTLAAKDRVLVKDQTAGEENGVYVVGASPARAVDYAASWNIVGSVIFVVEGTANALTAWKCETPSPIVVDTDALVFSAFGGGAHVHSGGDITSGTVDEARIDADIARDSELPDLGAHTSDATDAHDASAISNVPAGGIAATDVQAAINELDTEKSGTAHTHTHAAATGQTADDHHPQAHTHPAEGAVVVTHASTTGQTATDHHAAPAAGPDADVAVDGTGAAGTAGAFARSGHGHKVVTDPGVASTAAFGDAAAAGTGGTIQRQGHKHAMPANPVTAHEAASDPHTGYVREADALWVDLTDGGATTLHSHAGGGGAADTVSNLIAAELFA